MPATFDEIAAIAQKYVESRPVVLLGCGASAPYGLPTMDQLSTRLLKSIKVGVGETGNAQWQRFTRKLRQTGDLELTLQNGTLSTALRLRIVSETWNYATKFDLKLLSDLLAGSKTLALTGLLRHFLRTANPQVSIVTTNYDRLAEYAADLTRAYVNCGFSDGHIQWFDPGCGSFNKAKYKQGVVNIWKVHGSLDWFKDNSNTPIAIPLATSIPEGLTPLIVTPGVSKYLETHLEPFREVMGKSDAALESAKSFLCIGYGFNDMHVQPFLEKRVKLNNISIIAAVKTLTAQGRRFLLEPPVPKFLILEEARGGTRVYTPKAPQGEILSGQSVWQLSEFTKMIGG